MHGRSTGWKVSRGKNAMRHVIDIASTHQSSNGHSHLFGHVSTHQIAHGTRRNHKIDRGKPHGGGIAIRCLLFFHDAQIGPDIVDQLHQGTTNVIGIHARNNGSRIGMGFLQNFLNGCIHIVPSSWIGHNADIGFDRLLQQLRLLKGCNMTHGIMDHQPGRWGARRG